MSACKVFIAVPTEEEFASADAVAKTLATKYDISDVTIRSSESPIDRFLTSFGDDVKVAWFFFPGSSSFPAVEKESSYPVLEIAAGQQEPKDVAWTIAKWCALGCDVVGKKVRKAARERRQAKLVGDAQLQTKSFKYHKAMSGLYDNKKQITGENIGLEAQRGKVRDRIDVDDNTIALVTTDRQSGFDRQLALIPYKGAVLNLTSAFWFEQTKDIIKNHIVAVPHPYVTIAKKCQPFPIEFVMR